MPTSDPATAGFGARRFAQQPGGQRSGHGLASIEAAMTAWPAVVLAGASFRGVGLPDCVTQGQAAAARVGAWLAATPESTDAEAVALAG